MLSLIQNQLNTTLKYFYSVPLTFVIREFWSSYVFKTSFMPLYYVRSENMWQDGFLFDFLQKKTADAWVRSFVIYTGFLFSERLVFDSVVRLYMDNLVWPGHKLNMFEMSNVSEMLSSVIATYVTFFFLMFALFMLTL